MLLGLIDIIFLIFAFFTLFFVFVFLVLYLEHRKIKINFKDIITPTVSIVIPALNEEKTIISTINAIRKLKYPNIKEIIVIDDGSTDHTGELARSMGVKVLRKENQGQKSYPLNFVLKKIKGEIMACVDADSYPAPDSLMRAIQYFKDDDVASVTTSVYVKNPKTLIERLQNIEYTLIVWSRKLLEVIDSIYVTPGAMSLYRTDVIKKLGGFDNKNLTEDIEIAWRLLHNGYKIKMSLESEVYTGIPRKLKEWWQQRLRWNIGGLQTTLNYLPKFTKKKTMLNFVVPFFTFSFFFSIIGFLIFAYVMLGNLYSYLYYGTFSLIGGTGPIQRDILDPILIPNIFSIFGLIILITAIVWIVISYRRTNKNLNSIVDLLDLVIYLSLYITLFPIILLQAVWRLIINKKKW
jgi:poly-beta-1,6-N-acetyl-D-glucosamine synthase